MDVAVYPTHLTYRVIGGILDLSFFGGPGPEQVVRQYQQVIGAFLHTELFVQFIRLVSCFGETVSESFIFIEDSMHRDELVMRRCLEFFIFAAFQISSIVMLM
jgi:hypothetical protein